MPAIGIGISPHFQNKRFSFAQYWDTLIGDVIMGETGFALMTEDGDNLIQE